MSKKRDSHCILTDDSIFIGFTSLPIGEDVKFKDEVFKFFKRYQETLVDNFKNTTEKGISVFHKHFYVPAFYFIFGQFDLCVLSLIDSFEFAAQTFYPFDPMYPTDTEAAKKRSFDHQVILNIAPLLKEGDEDRFITLANNAFLNQKPLPLVAICQLKLNNGLLIGAGTDFMRCVIKGIRRYFDYQFKVKNVWKETKENETQLIILESYSWHEIIILLFSDSFNKMLQFILGIREMTVRGMEKGIAFDMTEDLIKTMLKKKPALFSSMRGNIPSDQIDWNNYRRLPTLISKSDIDNTPIFSNTTTTLGFRFEIFENGTGTEKVKPIKPDDEVYGFCRWSTKGGGLSKAISIVGGESIAKASREILLSDGRGDFIYPRFWKSYPYKDIGFTKMFTKEFIESISTALKKPSIGDYVISSRIMIGWEPKDMPSLKRETESSFYIKKLIEELLIDSTIIKEEIYKPLRNSGISEVVAERILNALALFNQGIGDPFLFSNFLELKPYVERLMNAVERWSKEDFPLLAETTLNKIVDFLEKGWRNRFQTYWKMGEITDFNLEFKGGIQQLVSAFDGAYKAVSSLIGAPNPITVVGGEPRFYSTEDMLYLNFFDVFMPESFAARISYEAAWHYFTTYRPEERHDIARFLSEIIGAESEVKEVIDEMRKVLPKKYHIWIRDITPITLKLFQCVFSDLNTYYYTYFKNTDLFIFWLRNLFISDTGSWKKADSRFAIREDLLVDYLLRQFFVLKDDPNALEIIRKYWAESELQVSVDFLQETQDFIQKLFKYSPAIKNWYQAAKEYAQKGYEKIYNKYDNPKNVAEEVREAFLKRGKVYSYDVLKREGDYSRFCFVQLLSYAYLSLLKDECLKNRPKDCNILLKRDKEGKPIVDINNDANILFDRRGGTFVYDPVIRREYFKYRCAFIMSLWDMSLKEKFYTIKKYTEKS